MQFSVDLAAKAIFRNHTFNCEFYHFYRVLSEHIASFCVAVAAKVTGMTEVNFLNQFFTGQNYFVSIDYDYMISGIHMRSKSRFVFATKDFCNFGCHAAKSFISCVNNEPFTFDIGRISHKRFHPYADQSSH